MTLFVTNTYAGMILDASASGVTVVTGTPAQARTALELGTAALAASSDFAAASHTHDDRYYTNSEVDTLLLSYLTVASAAASYQLLDADLTAIGGLSGTAGYLKKTAANTWSLDTSTFLVAADLSSYLTSAVAASTYLPLAGGTLTGQLCTAPSVAAHSGFKIPAATAAPDTPSTGDMWVTTSGNDFAIYVASTVRTVAFVNRAQTYTAKQTFLTSTAGSASINIPHGVTVTSLSNGDVWSTTAGWFVRTNGATEQLATYTARISSNTSSSTPTPDFAAYDQYLLTALAANATFGSPTGTLSDGMKRIIRIKDNGTARTLSWNAIYRAIGVTLPSTTVISKTHYVGMVYNAADTKWDVLAVGAEA